MANETFSVSTIYYNGDELVRKTTLAHSRPEAIKQAERMGKIDENDHSKVRQFLETGSMILGQLVLCSGDGWQWTGVATINLITAD